MSKELLKIAQGLYDLRFRDVVENYSLWKTEFKASDYSVPAFLCEEPFSDVSYHNDTCPRFIDWTRGIEVLVEADDVNKREYDEGCRFTVQEVHTCEDGCCYEYIRTLYECDEEESLRIFLKGYVKSADITTVKHCKP
jgi:hypothetical protein